ncbi:MAG TPA: ABC transporter permease [Steroidobacteraceae bacterium]|nr:ABC transporter permease [Steroidobacteraceae bacterium]
MQFTQDLRIAARSLLRAPGFTALTTTVLSLGLAVVVTMYGVVHTIAYVPPPVPEPDSLVGIQLIDRVHNADDVFVGSHMLEDWRAAQSKFEDLGGQYVGTAIVSGEGMPARYDGGFVTGAFFAQTRLKPMFGRLIEPRDALPGAQPVVVLSHDLWGSRYNYDPKVIGRTLKVNGEVAAVIGVMPKKVEYPAADLWVPVREKLAELPRGKANDFRVIGRLKPGVTIDEASAELTTIAARLAKLHPDTDAGLEPDVAPVARSELGQNDLHLFQTLLASVFLVLVIACVNVSGLMLVRATGRTQEAGVRRAVGAGRGRLALQMLAESLVIGALASLLGLTLGAVGLEVIGRAVRQLESIPAWWTFVVDGRIALFAIAVGVLSTVAAGLFPAFRVSGVDVNGILREGTRDTGLSTGRIIRGLVVVEIALSCVLLTSAGIMVKSAITATHKDLGVDVRPFMTGRIGLPDAPYPKDRQRQFIEQLQTRASAIPGATAATIVNTPPGHGAGGTLYALPGRSYASQSEYPSATQVNVTPGFFATMHGRFVAGRDFTATDKEDTLPVAIVNETFARRVWPGESPLGQRLRLSPTAPDSQWLTVVGLVGDINHDNDPFGTEQNLATVYVPFAQEPERFFSLVLRTDGDPHVLGGAIREAVRQIDPDLAVYWLRTIPENRAIKGGGIRIVGGMFVAFGLVTIALAAAGIYGVLSYSVAQSAREIAIRRALGAPDGGIIGAVARRSGWQLGLGLGLGVLLAPLMTFLIGQAVGATNFHDPVIYTIVLLTLATAIGAATAVPLRRALALQPGAALRHT